MQINELNEQMTKRSPVVTIMLPKPTKGDTTPPKAKQIAPKRADAVPAFFRSLSMANVVEDVKVRPIENKRIINKIS